MKRPVVGVMPLYDDEKDSLWMLPGYMDMLMEEGAMPIMLPLTDNMDVLLPCLELCDGFLLTGGHDVDPTVYKEDRKDTCGPSNRIRDFMDQKALRHAIEKDKAVLGICRGIQLMNASEGGTLYQDLETERENVLDHHMDAPYNRTVHPVEIKKETKLHAILEEDSIGVNSYHHQGIKETAPGYTASAVSPDGLVEAIEKEGNRFIVGVQWHPEHLYKTEAHARKLVHAFVQKMQ